MKLKYKDLIKALNAIEDERRVPEEVVLEALKEAMSKAYKKDAELSDISVETEINCIQLQMKRISKMMNCRCL